MTNTSFPLNGRVCNNAINSYAIIVEFASNFSETCSETSTFNNAHTKVAEKDENAENP